ncbi:hypothetical protein DFQ26_000548 [Actinomortierella ambigua]|nr:hypothetical protein DFQ26_000548 [Actinomortierella ambigua]
MATRAYDKAVTTATNVDNTSSDWMIDARDTKAILHGCFDSLYDALRASKVANIHVDIVRVSADANDKRNDILNYNHSKLYSASLFNVVAADESSITQAVSALFLRRNQNIEVLRIKGWPTEDKDREDNLIELFCQSDHLRAVQGSVHYQRNARIL